MEVSVAEIEVSYRPAIGAKPIIKTALDCYRTLQSFYSEDTICLTEEFWVAYVNRGNRVLGVFKASCGGLTGTVADPRLILAVALKIAATGIILSHNHPSGNLNPSRQDIDLTERIKEGGKFLDIKVLDHLIISPDGEYYSFANEGIL
jgi:DNA repair protein RadC